MLAHGTGALNIDGCRNALRDDEDADALTARSGGVRGFAGQYVGGTAKGAPPTDLSKGRWPANVILTHSEDCVETGTVSDSFSRNRTEQWPGFGQKERPAYQPEKVDGQRTIWDCVDGCPVQEMDRQSGDSGGASRFFYTAKANKKERPYTEDGTKHPTVKPLALMRYLVRLVTPPDGLVLDPFGGSGTTAEACLLEGMRCAIIEKELDYIPLIELRIERVQA